MCREASVTQAGDYRFFAGSRSDPFFFDVLGTLNNRDAAGPAGQTEPTPTTETPSKQTEAQAPTKSRRPRVSGHRC